MPRRTKTYRIQTNANVFSATAQIPSNPDRISLLVQMIGAGGLLSFGIPVSDQIDMTFTANMLIKWDQADTCPTEAVFLAATTTGGWYVLEGLSK